jgi:hypothetical protein
MDRMMKVVIAIYIALLIYGLTVVIMNFGEQSFNF